LELGGCFCFGWCEEKMEDAGGGLGPRGGEGIYSGWGGGDGMDERIRPLRGHVLAILVRGY
jgi:hypothetical protein